ncbi:MAG: hypothetical protein EXQ84_08010, partial [Rhodospirillaceae bacterium]|nr:hypothetical protein [Rhodospirillaceae bacterium]
NYDGFAKHLTEIGPEAFIGSNTALVAPVTVGARAIVAAGSVITRDVAAGDLAVARGRQQDIPGGADRFRQSRAAKSKPGAGKGQARAGKGRASAGKGETRASAKAAGKTGGDGSKSATRRSRPR